MNKQTKYQRKQYFIDPDVQSGLLKRLVIYWGASMLFITLPLAFFKFFTDPGQMFLQSITEVYMTHWPILAMMLLFLPFAVNDAIKYSNRFAGPIYRLRCELKRFEDGNRLREFRFRKDDFWQDVAVSVCKIADRLNELEDQLAESRQTEKV